TLDGDGHSITAMDPVGSHFTGAVITNAGTSANVINLTVTASGLSDVCDGGTARLRGIMFDGASGSITGNTVTGVRQGLSGCQEGNAIEARNAPFAGDTGSVTVGPDVNVTISNNTVNNYQKNGITVNGAVVANVTGNIVTGDGSISYIAQNGIQIGFGGTATVKSNTITGNAYAPATTEACGLLLYRADGVKAQANDIFNNQKNMCNYGKGSGNVKPAN
ncbi:MAG TPA: NosD domain-containing protein, partial [Gemmatimonadaceae bacterium]